MMNTPTLPPDEMARLAALRRYAILDTPAEAAFDRITRLVSVIFRVPIATITLIDAERQWFKSCVGLDATETSRDVAFCAHAILHDEVLIVPDARDDARFCDNPLVTGAPHIRFYAGAPMITGDGFKLGTVCLIDTVPRDFSAADAAILADFAAIVTDEMELRLATAQLSAEITEHRQTEESLRMLGAAVEQAKDSIVITDANLELPGPKVVFVNPAFTRMTGFEPEQILGKTPRILQGLKTSRTVLDRLQENLRSGEGFSGETVNYRADGMEFDIEWRVAPLRNSANEITHFVAIQRDITRRKAAEMAIEATQRELRNASRQSGMAEVATSVLHNVGNVLNSVNISCSVIEDKLRKSRIGSVAKTAELLRSHAGNMASFFDSDPAGQELPKYLGKLAAQLAEEQDLISAELHSLSGNIDHIKDIVAMQQNYARVSAVSEIVDLAELTELSLGMSGEALGRHKIEVVREYAQVPPATMEKSKVLQILVNLISNAKYACNESGRAGKRITLQLTGDVESVRIAVIDNGVGISPENLTRIFAHGFTTKADGHGFGLHGSVLVAREMDGDLTVHSAGLGKGATFTLILPVSSSQTLVKSCQQD
jgi:PAS domain S-box-containing protein